ncbi:MAG: leucyl aminopeptidase [Verrucomicrobia bacterium]|nr:leucyl aminopeptidase [Cytophagales bacterium]
MQIILKTGNPTDTQTLILPVFQDEKLAENLQKIAETYNLSQDRLTRDFKADFKEIHSFYASESKIILLGLGKNAGQKEVIRAFRWLFYCHKTKFSQTTSIDLQDFTTKSVENVINGVLLGGYDIKLYKTEKKTENNFFFNQPVIEVFVDENRLIEAEKSISAGQVTAETQMRVMDLVNAPANKKIPQTLVNFATESGSDFGFEVKVFNQEQLKALGFEALLAVGQGSHNPPFCIVMEYKPENAGAHLKKIGLVGKGITFDTGGVSIKDSLNLHMMKSDMGGAAAVLGAMELAAKMQLPVHLIGIVPTAENSVDALAFKPSDVIGSYSGKTIEIIDTDAEGRLILADALAYLTKNYQTETIIDLATLTGSVIATLGYAAAGMFTKNDELAHKLLKISLETGEKLWRLPLWDDYKDELNSDIADVKNHHSKPIAGAIVAAKFLEVFTHNHPAWVHLDIAGTSFADSEFSSMRSATAFGVRLLIDFLKAETDLS